MHGSGMRYSTEAPFDMSALISLHNSSYASEIEATSGIGPFTSSDDAALEDGWEQLRWTKRVVHEIMRRLKTKDSFLMFQTPAFDTLSNMKNGNPRDRIDQHIRTTAASIKHMEKLISSMNERLAKLQALVAGLRVGTDSDGA